MTIQDDVARISFDWNQIGMIELVQLSVPDELAAWCRRRNLPPAAAEGMWQCYRAGRVHSSARAANQVTGFAKFIFGGGDEG